MDIHPDVQLWLECKQQIAMLNEAVEQENPAYIVAVEQWQAELEATHGEPDFQLYNKPGRQLMLSACANQNTRGACQTPCTWWQMPFLGYLIGGGCYPDKVYLAQLATTFARFDTPPVNQPVVAILMELGNLVGVDVRGLCYGFINGEIPYATMATAVYILATAFFQEHIDDPLLSILMKYVTNLRVGYTIQMVVAVLLLSEELDIDPVRGELPDGIDVGAVQLLTAPFRVYMLEETNRTVSIAKTMYQSNIGNITDLVPVAYGNGSAIMPLAIHNSTFATTGMLAFLNMDKAPKLDGGDLIRFRPVESLTATDVVFELMAVVGSEIKDIDARNSATSSVKRVRDIMMRLYETDDSSTKVTAREFFAMMDQERQSVVNQSLSEREEIIGQIEEHADKMDLKTSMKTMSMLLDFSIVDHALRTDPLTVMTTILKSQGLELMEAFNKKLKAVIAEETRQVKVDDEYIQSKIDTSDKITANTYDKIMDGTPVVAFTNSIILAAIKARVDRVIEDIRMAKGSEVANRIESNYYEVGKMIGITDHEAMATRALDFEIDSKFDLGDVKHAVKNMKPSDVEQVVRGVTLINHKRNKDTNKGFIQGLPNFLDTDDHALASLYKSVYKELTGNNMIFASMQAETDLNNELKHDYNMMKVNFDYTLFAARMAYENRGFLGMFGGFVAGVSATTIGGIIAGAVSIIALIAKLANKKASSACTEPRTYYQGPKGGLYYLAEGKKFYVNKYVIRDCDPIINSNDETIYKRDLK
jgi:hypothetical protein